MTEMVPEESHEFDFGLHELAFVDPEVSEQLELVKKANEYLASDTTLSMELAQGIRRQLDSTWPHMGETVMANGPTVVSDPQLRRTRLVNLKDKPLVSNGWAVEEVHHLRDGRVMSVHELHEPGATVSEDDIDYTTYAIRYMLVEPRPSGNVAYYGRIGDVSVTYGRVSDTYVSNVLHYFHPEQMDAVDDALLQADTADDQLDNLQDLELVLENKYPEANLDFSANLSRYVSMCLDLDMALPYECTVSAHAIEQQPDGTMELLGGNGMLQGLVAIAGLRARLRPFLDGKERRERTMVDFLVIGRYIKPEEHVQTSVYFPLANLIEHKSLRTSYYE